MKITIESTSKLVTINGVPARIWEGQTETGIKMHCYITRVAIDEEEPRSAEFDRELQKHRPASKEIQAIDFRLIL